MTPPPDPSPPPGTDTSGQQPYDSGLLANIIAIHFPGGPTGIAVEFWPDVS
jgi:hypothetical protein